MITNPFTAGPPVAPEQFYGRDLIKRDIRNQLGAITPQCVSLIGYLGIGKTSLLRYIHERILEFCTPAQKPLTVNLDLQKQHFQTPADLTEGLRRGIQQHLGSSPWPVEDPEDPYAIEDGLTTLRDQGYRLILLIDEFEKIQATLHNFQSWGDDWRSKASHGLFTLVIASTRPLGDIYTRSGLTSPFENIFTEVEVGSFPPDEWHKLVKEGFAKLDQVPTSQDLDLIDQLSGGIPYYVQLAASLLALDPDRDHTRVTEKFEHQTDPRFQELIQDLTDPELRVIRQCAAGIRPTGFNEEKTGKRLQRLGLIRPDGTLFSRTFTQLIRATQPQDPMPSSPTPDIFRYSLPKGSSARDRHQFEQDIQHFKNTQPDWIVEYDRPYPDELEAILLIPKVRYPQNQVGYILARSMAEILGRIRL